MPDHCTAYHDGAGSTLREVKQKYQINSQEDEILRRPIQYLADIQTGELQHLYNL
jgi:hypothetical protein